MSWEIHEAAERIAEGWYSELEETRKRNAVLGRENAKLRELLLELWDNYEPIELDDNVVCDFSDRMHELGIEVDE